VNLEDLDVNVEDSEKRVSDMCYNMNKSVLKILEEQGDEDKET
jgi:hypothetical protein